MLVDLLPHLLRSARALPQRRAPPRDRPRPPPAAARARAEAHGRAEGAGGPAGARAEWVPGLLAAPAGWFSHHSSPRSSAISTRDSAGAEHRGKAGAKPGFALPQSRVAGVAARGAPTQTLSPPPRGDDIITSAPPPRQPCPTRRSFYTGVDEQRQFEDLK